MFYTKRISIVRSVVRIVIYRIYDGMKEVSTKVQLKPWFYLVVAQGKTFL